VEVGQRNGGITPEEAPQFTIPISGNNWLRDAAPSVGAVDAAWPQRGPFEIVELGRTRRAA
jgi:hypothetical protein